MLRSSRVAEISSELLFKIRKMAYTMILTGTDIRTIGIKAEKQIFE